MTIPPILLQDEKGLQQRPNWMMTQYANVTTRRDPRMKRLYARVRKRHGYNVTIVHVASKMLVIIRAMLTRRELYAERNERPYQQKLKRLSSLQ